MSAAVNMEISDAVATIALNRPHRLNAINGALLEGLCAALSAVHADAAVGALVLRGEGRAFCAGDDLKEFGDQARNEAEARAHIARIQQVTRLLMGGDKPVVGAVHGWAVGGGFEWALNCDFVIMADGACCFFPEIKLGVFVTGAVTALLPRLVGLQKAKEMILLGERIDAAAALDLGVAGRVVAEADLFAEARALAERLAALPAAARAAAKRALNGAGSLTLEQAMEVETEAAVRGFLDPATRARVAETLK